MELRKLNFASFERNPNIPEIEFTKMNKVETAAVCFKFAQPNKSKIGLKTIPPPIPIKPDKNPTIAPIIIAYFIFIPLNSVLFSKNLVIEILQTIKSS